MRFLLYTLLVFWTTQHTRALRAGARAADRTQHTTMRLGLYELPPPRQNNDTRDPVAFAETNSEPARGYLHFAPTDGYDMRYGPHTSLGDPPESNITIDRLRALQDIHQLLLRLCAHDTPTHTKLSLLRQNIHLFPRETELDENDVTAPNVFAGGDILDDWLAGPEDDP